jgi:hypothetical protein
MKTDPAFFPVKNDPVITFDHMDDASTGSKTGIGVNMHTRYLVLDILLITAMAVTMYCLLF